MLRKSQLAIWLLLASLCGATQETTTPSPPDDAIGEVFATDASVHGSVLLAAGGTRLLSGSTVSAGAQAASVRLQRGGEVRVCPGTSVAVNGTAGRELMLSLSSGALEANYSVGASADSIVTPDFRLVLAGPGQFHVAIGADSKGNSCVKALDGNSAAILVYELMGSGTYQVKPSEQVYFKNGSVAGATAEVLGECGCPGSSSAERAVERASSEPPAPPSTAPTSPATPVQPLAESSVPASAASDVHVQVDAPLVFRAEAEPEAPPEPDAVAELRSHPPTSVLDALLNANIVAPPTEATVAQKPKKRRGFFARVGGFFAAMFSGR